MKKSLILLATLLICTTATFSQTKDDLKVVKMIIQGNYSFEFIGDKSSDLVDSLFTAFPKTKRKGYIWKFKNIQIEGIEEALTFQVHQGIYGTYPDSDTTACKGGCYFNTFMNEKYKKERLIKMKETEENAILIYIKEGKQYGISTREEAEIVEAFIFALYES